MAQSIAHPHRPKVQYSGKKRLRRVEANPSKGIRMNRKSWLTLFTLLAAGSLCLGATVPAGTVIVVRTNAGISTHATPGNHFTATLEQGLGDVRAGSQCQGIIRASRGSRSTTSSSPLTLALTGVSANGHMVKIKTDSVTPEGAHTAKTRGRSFSFGEDTFPVGTRLQFRLTHAVNL